MKLLKLYEDLFQYLCQLNRMAKALVQPDIGRVRDRIKELLQQVQLETVTDVHLAKQVKALELPVIFTIDNLISTSGLKFASEWRENRLAKERNELTGDDKFFDLLDADLQDTSEEAAQRLAVFYSCLGLGFTGAWQGHPEKLREYMERIQLRIKKWMDDDSRARISEEAYNYTDKRKLTEPPSNKMVLVAAIFLFLSLSVMVAYYGLYAIAVGDLSKAVETIRAQAGGGGGK